ncbi:geraniol dehydrogenase 1-like [Olea europaea var. sylvestris]|uniref:geraniol dehydrogenase 1-like n=1 Tax=Olea europaea var. sylvestris TaxID=158386 RepID=UPI000C1CD69C|nr:geraniol dehydrogenase 1-like [Olea europaea var. sylvestris]
MTITIFSEKLNRLLIKKSRVNLRKLIPNATNQRNDLTVSTFSFIKGLIKLLCGLLVAAGTLDGIIDTVSATHPLLALISLLKPHGKMVLVGAPAQPLELPVFPLISGRKIIAGSGVGGMKETQEMIDFAAKHNILPDVEIIPIDYINTAMDRLAKSDVKYRFVIDIAKSLKAE